MDSWTIYIGLKVKTFSVKGAKQTLITFCSTAKENTSCLYRTLQLKAQVTHE